MKVIKHLPKYKITKIRFSSWLYRIATNEMNQHFRKKTHISFDFLLPKDEPVSLNTKTPDYELKKMEEERQNKSDFTLIMKYIKNLKSLDQSIITLRFFENKKFAEIGDILKMRTGTVKVRMNRAIKKLKQYTEKENLSTNYS